MVNKNFKTLLPPKKFLDAANAKFRKFLGSGTGKEVSYRWTVPGLIQRVGLSLKHVTGYISCYSNNWTPLFLS